MQMGSTFSAIGRYVFSPAVSTIIATAALGTAAIFTVQDSSGNRVIQCFGTGCTIAQSLSVNGINISSGATLAYPIIPLTGSGVSTATGTSVWGDLYMPYAGNVRTVGARLSQTANNNKTTVDILKNGKSILSTPITIDSTEKDTSTAATSAVINSASGSFAVGDIFTFNVLSPATTPGKDLKLRMSILRTSFP